MIREPLRHTCKLHDHALVRQLDHRHQVESPS